MKDFPPLTTVSRTWILAEKELATEREADLPNNMTKRRNRDKRDYQEN
jgi:hypothetical protein